MLSPLTGYGDPWLGMIPDWVGLLIQLIQEGKEMTNDKTALKQQRIMEKMATDQDGEQ